MNPSATPWRPTPALTARGAKRRLPTVRCNGWLADELVVVGMAADPKPVHSVRDRRAKGAVVEADADTVEPAVADALEVQRGM